MKKIAEIIAVMSVLALAAACGGGGSSSNPATPVPPPAMTDTTAPSVMFDPATGSVLTGQTFAATLTATDDVGVTSGPDVNCSNGGSFANNLFTAPDVTAETTSVCTATASDAAGNEGSATLTMTVNPDTTAPVVMFTPATGSVLTGQTFAATLTATDDVGVTSGPDVSCSNGGSFANNLFTAPDVTTETTSVCTATAGDAAGNEGSATLTMTVTLPASVIISGQLTFDFVPHNTASNGLDYSAITQNPMRGVVVQALNASGTVLDSDISDASGNYALDVSPVIDVRIRARAVLRSTSGATWDVRVTDNTNNNALHVLDGSLADSGTTDSIRNLNAGSGWDGSAYTGERAAGPFAILDPVYDTMQKFAAVDPDIAFPPVEFRWSVDNRAVDGNREDGEITTSSYVPDGGDCGNIYLLGDDDADTDEYDPGVVVREWGHYFEHCLSRSDSPGGPHAPGERLDPRLALAEGWGDAVAAIGTGDPVVRNTFGPGQGQGSVVDVEANTNALAGWYNARSVSSILYDVYDSTDDGADVLSLGLGPIYRTLVDPGYTGTPVFTTIFTVLDRLKVVAPGNTAAIEALAAGQDINGTGADGAGETNDGGIASALPVYRTAVVDGAAVEVCSVDDAGTVNKLGNRVFVRVSVPTEGTYTIAMSSPRGNPVFAIFRAGTLIATAFGAVNSETWTGVLPAGEYVIEAFDFNNIESLIVEQPADYCYDITAITGTPPPDTTPPVAIFDPATGSVPSGQTFAATLTATDDIGVTSGPTVVCSNGGSFANNLFTAPVVTTETTSVCTATARDAAGNEGSATLTMTVTPPPDTTDPVVMFTPATGSVPGGQTFAAVLTATDDIGVTSGPDVSCSNGGSFANNLFTAPDVMTETTSVCTAMARDAAGNEGSATLTMTVTPPPDTTDPVVMFTPATGSVPGGQTFAATLTATDDVGVTSGPDVSCSNGGSFAGNLFTAPDVMTETTSVCTAMARDAAGNEGSATLTMTVTPPDTTDPVVMFTPATGSVPGGQTFAATLTATDDVGVTSGPDVSCSNGGSFANNLFTAPDVMTETTSVCTATAGDAAGNEGSATLTMTVTPPDTTDPIVMFSPATGSVPGWQTFAATLTATDDVGVTSGPDVSCSNGGSFANNLFTAPDVTTETTSVCTATAGDAAGNEGSATLTMTVTPPDTTDPVVMFSPATGSVLSGQTFAATLTATDNVGVTSGPDVSCSNGGSFANNLFTAPSVTTETTSVCTATARDAIGNEGTATLTITVTPAAGVIISGRLTFDFVPHDITTNADTTTNGLDYAAIMPKPMRGVVVQALDGSGAVLDSDISDASGNYALDVSPGTDVRIRARAVLLRTSGAIWDVRVTDNTNNNALYVLDGSLADSGTTDSTRNLHADSGWDGSAYTSPRAAGPFAILDPVYDTMQKFAAVDPDIVFPPVEFRWSVNNRAVTGFLEDGDIGGPLYASPINFDCPPFAGSIYLLGDDNANTDEYDPGVIVHEWGHYFEDCLSRADSPGGPHTLGNDRLDPRLALAEGWGNAVAAIGTGDPVVRNTFGPGQGRGVPINVERNAIASEPQAPAGWYNEASVQSILYDLYDSADDGADVLSLGLGPIYRTLVHPGYTGTPVFTTIFTVLDRLKAEAPGNTAAIEALAAGQDIDGTGADGAGETNDGGIATALPVYHTAVLDGAAVEICSVDDAGSFNKLGNRVFVRVSVPAEGTYTITMSGSQGNPAFRIFRAGILIATTGGQVNSETWTGVLPAGEYVMEAYDLNNVSGVAAAQPEDFCYEITLTTG